MPNVSLGPHFEALIEEKIRSGRYQNASEVVRAGLRLLEDSEIAREQQIERLRQAIIEGEESGEPQPFDFETFIASKRSA
jgi:antitoxin ParD1/3/4